MSLPAQERRALEETRRFLLDLSSGEEKRIPSATRRRQALPARAGARCLEQAGHADAR